MHNTLHMFEFLSFPHWIEQQILNNEMNCFVVRADFTANGLYRLKKNNEITCNECYDDSQTQQWKPKKFSTKYNHVSVQLLDGLICFNLSSRWKSATLPWDIQSIALSTGTVPLIRAPFFPIANKNVVNNCNECSILNHWRIQFICDDLFKQTSNHRGNDRQNIRNGYVFFLITFNWNSNQPFDSYWSKEYFIDFLWTIWKMVRFVLSESLDVP